MRRPSPAIVLSRRARAVADCVTEMEMSVAAETKAQAERWRRQRANPPKLAPMAKRKAAAPKPKRRPRAEIDRNYFLGDVLIKTGVAMAIAIAAIMLYAPYMWREALAGHHYTYPIVLGAFTVVGVGVFLAGRLLRRAATQWEAD
jgi:hypothetical protein